jgi:hypothetical protein
MDGGDRVFALKLDAALVLQRLDEFTGGTIHPVDELVGWGFPKEFVRPLAKTHVDDPDPFRLKGFNSPPRRYLRGVSDVDLLHALGRAVGSSRERFPRA